MNPRPSPDEVGRRLFPGSSEVYVSEDHARLEFIYCVEYRVPHRTAMSRRGEIVRFLSNFAHRAVEGAAAIESEEARRVKWQRAQWCYRLRGRA